MDILLDWAGYLARWGHVMAGITWIGTSFYFNWLDLSERPPVAPTLKPNVQGEVHEMHGGSYYYHERYWPTEPSKRMLNHSGPAQLTFLTGVLLVVLIYWLGASVYLVNPSANSLPLSASILISAAILFVPYIVYDQICKKTSNNKVILAFAAILILVVGYVALSVFSARAAFLHVGAMLGTIMALNVYSVIIPNHIAMQVQVKNGQSVDIECHKKAKRRSQHNNYFTLPVVFSMLSVHFPLASANRFAVLTLFLVMGAGFLLRYARNTELLSDKKNHPASALAIAFLAAGIGLTYIPATGAVQDMTAFSDAQERIAFEIVQTRCAVCHSAVPTMEGFTAPPGGVLMETVDEMLVAKDRMFTQAIATDIMPPGNMTEITDAERAQLGEWLAAVGAKEVIK